MTNFDKMLIDKVFIICKDADFGKYKQIAELMGYDDEGYVKEIFSQKKRPISLKNLLCLVYSFNKKLAEQGKPEKTINDFLPSKSDYIKSGIKGDNVYECFFKSIDREVNEYV